MAKKRHTPEEVLNKLREAEEAIAEGSTVAEAARRVGVTEEIVVLAQLTVFRGAPDHIRSDNGPAFTARAAPNGLDGWEPGRSISSPGRRGRTACEFRRKVEG